MLYGMPFAVKDCIDVATMQTTAACPAFAYTAQRSATVVERLLEAGGDPHRQDQPRSIFDALHHLQELRIRTLKTWEVAEFLFLPTTGTTYTIAEVEADPIQLNANLGAFTNFVNLLDLCAIAVPTGFDSGGLPVGSTLIAPCFNEVLLIDIGGEFHRRAGVPMGASRRPLPSLT